MSYHRLGSVQSAPLVNYRSRRALGSIQSNPILHRRVPRYLQVMRAPLGTLGDDTLGATVAPANPATAASAPALMLTDPQFQQMIDTMSSVRDWQKQWVQKDELQRWIQIAATVSIPVLAGIWRAIGFKRAGVD